MLFEVIYDSGDDVMYFCKSKVLLKYVVFMVTGD